MARLLSNPNFRNLSPLNHPFNCTTNYDLEFNTTLPLCQADLPLTGVCYQTTCLQYAQICQPCTYVCYTDSCWIQSQQTSCVNAMTQHDCTIYYGEKMTTYSCNMLYSDAITLCNQSCPGLSCGYYNYNCQCINTDCLKRSNNICQYYIYNHTVVTANYTYFVNGTLYNGHNITTQTCDDEACINDFKNATLPYQKTYWLKSPQQLTAICSYDNMHPNANCMPDTDGAIALIVLGSIGAFMTIAIPFFCVGWCIYGCSKCWWVICKEEILCRKGKIVCIYLPSR